MKKLDADHPLIKQIASIHESIPAEYKDYEVSSINTALREESIRLLMRHNDDEMVVIENEGTLIAFIWFHAGERLHIKSLWVAPSERRKGYATRLKKFVHSVSLKRGITEVYSHVDSANYKMKRLNEKLGYSTEHNEMRLEMKEY